MKSGKADSEIHLPDEALARKTVARAPIGICHVDASGGLRQGNHALAAILGFGSPEEMVATREGETLFHEQSPHESLAALIADHAAAFPPTDTIFRARDGSPVFARVEGFPVEGTDDALWCLFIHETGVERAREIELARALAELENTMQTIPDILYTLDVEARLVRWNRKLETVTGFSAQELQGRPGFELFPDAEKRTFAKAIMDAFATGYAEFETRLLGRSGGMIDYQWTAVPLQNEKREVVGLAGAGRDVSERRRSEVARRDLEHIISNRAREWQSTFDSIESPIVIADPDFRISRLNRSALDLFGDAAFADIVGRSLDDFSSHEPWRTFRNLVESPGEVETAEAHDPFSGQTWHIAKSILTGFSTSGEREEEEAERSILIARDVTGMLELQEVARKSQVMSAVGQLIVGVAHEVRNPIFGISATLDAFEASFAMDDDSRQFLEILRGEIGRLSELMQELLDYGRPTKVELHPGRLSDVAAQATRSCEKIGERTGVVIDNQVPPDLPLVPMDRKKLVQVFQNLLENAIQFSPSGSTVLLRGEVVEEGEKSWVAGTVLDSGPGFIAQDIGRIFEPFFTRRRGGTGLGLSIVQRLVDEHGGSLEASNRPEGGARMTVFLPVHESHV